MASGLYRLFRAILLSHPHARQPNSDLSRFLFRNNEPRWLLQSALVTLLTERAQPGQRYERAATEFTVIGRGAEHKATALKILDEYAEALQDYFALLQVALSEYLLVVALDGRINEHVLTYESPVEATEPRATSRLSRLTRSKYVVSYKTQMPSTLRSYHFIAEAEPGIHITRLVLKSDSDLRVGAEVCEDLKCLAGELDAAKRSPKGHGYQKLLELEAQTTLRRLADLVRRRRWEAEAAQSSLPASRIPACDDLAWAAASGEGTTNANGDIVSSILEHPILIDPQVLRQAADEIVQQQLVHDLSVEDDPISNRAHAYWRRLHSRLQNTAQIQMRVTFIIEDATPASFRDAMTYCLSLAAIVLSLNWVMLGIPPTSMAIPISEMPRGGDTDAIIAVLLLIPGFLYARLSLPDRHSIAGHLRAGPRLAANMSLITTAFLAANIAAGVDGIALQVVFILAEVVPLAIGLGLMLLLRHSASPERSGAAGLPRWAYSANQLPGDVNPHVVFFTSGVLPRGDDV